jgi:hypothetical protein
MASPLKSWISVLLGILAVYALYYNVAQIVDASRALRDEKGPLSLRAAHLAECDIYVGLIGTGALIAIYLLATLVLFLHKRERPHLDKGQTICYAMIGVLLALSFVSSSMAFVEDLHKSSPKNHMIDITLVLSCVRLVMAAAIVGCGIHVLKHDHS